MARTSNSRSHSVAITPITCMGAPTNVGKCWYIKGISKSGTFSSSGTIESGLLEEEMARIAEAEESGTHLG